MKLKILLLLLLIVVVISGCSSNNGPRDDYIKAADFGSNKVKGNETFNLIIELTNPHEQDEIFNINIDFDSRLMVPFGYTEQRYNGSDRFSFTKIIRCCNDVRAIGISFKVKPLKQYHETYMVINVSTEEGYDAKRSVELIINE